jgi:ribose-phosphate pyrophosphokinase
MFNDIRVILNNNVGMSVIVSQFNDGSVNVCLPPDVRCPISVGSIVVHAKLKNTVTLIALLLTVDACRRRFPDVENISLVAHYMPYARQDRVCNRGESLSSKVMADLINGCGFDSVTIADPHSDVIVALIDNCKVISAESIIASNEVLSNRIMGGFYTLVAPDAGSRKKIEKIATRFGLDGFVQGSKHRNLKTGELSEITFSGDVQDKHCLIIDDICDGGGTFVGLAEEMKKAGAISVDLYVTHGFFSRGTNAVNGENQAINQIFTTDSISRDHGTRKSLSIIGIGNNNYE